MKKHHKDPHRMDRFWLRHTASVPKGFLRYEVMRLLKENPMSGAELMVAIEKETDDRWKPSPGSMYPLLAWLVDNAYIEPLPRQENGQKRYRITANGEKFLDLISDLLDINPESSIHGVPKELKDKYPDYYNTFTNATKLGLI